jgi:hypothetical protein
MAALVSRSTVGRSSTPVSVGIDQLADERVVDRDPGAGDDQQVAFLPQLVPVTGRMRSPVPSISISTVPPPASRCARGVGEG